MRWATGETRSAVVFIADNADAPATGLAPTCSARRVSDGAVLASPTVVELSLGFYRFSFTAPSTDGFVFLVDAATLDAAHRYIPVEIPAGGYPDNLDATVSSRASAASVTALGTPAQSADTATLLARLTAVRAAALDLVDVAMSTRASAASVAALGSPAQVAALSAVSALVDDLELRLSAARALLLDNLDVAVSTRATPGQITVRSSAQTDIA